MQTILVTDKYHPAGLDALQSSSDLTVIYRTGMSRAELLDVIPQAHALIVRSATKVTAEVIEAGKQLKVIARAGVGVDNIDVTAASRKGIVVTNCPSGNTISAAEHTMSLLLSLARRVPQANQAVKAGVWDRTGKYMGTEITGKIIGVLGLGRIGAEVATRSLGLKMRVLAYDPFVTEDRARQLKVELMPLDELLGQVDFVTLHVPRSEQTENLLDRDRLMRIKPGAYLINCSRGGIVDEEALAEVIASGHLAGAALDVFKTEPPAADHPLLKLENVIVTPHLGASTAEAQEKVSVETAIGVVEGLTTGHFPNAVNLPDVPPATLAEIGPTLELVQRLGSFLAQLIDGSLAHVHILYAGHVASQPTRILTAALLKATLEHVLGEGINYVNAPLLAEERCIVVKETRQLHAVDYTSLIKVVMGTEKGEWAVVGTLFGAHEPRIVKLDEFALEASPVGDMLVFSNYDQPGVIGRIGNLLGDAGVNIAGMQLGRRKVGGQAVAIVNVDSALSPELLEKLRALPQIIDARFVQLPEHNRSAVL
ncbi:MAG: phosphoglycerate dehydrogenase [Candidatus Schekmanbacteria bacterium]|nr:phosphoglycerate dehydrogenase [Candidatus Schekmanbacteria bacterium]